MTTRSGEKILLLKPMTYMNLSGESVSAVMRYYKIAVDDVLVISDDIDMSFGKVRYRPDGSSGGQNGLKSIAQHLGTSDFSRIKVGIGRPERMSVSDWVLSRLSSEEMDMLRTEVFDQVYEKVTDWLES